MNPLDTNNFRHFLQFEDIGFDSEYEIPEPIDFINATFNLEQQSKRSARDREYGALNQIMFVDACSIQLIEERVINPQGDTFNHMDYGLQWLLYGLKIKGFEFKAYYILKSNGLVFKKQQLDFTDKDITDGETFVKCKLIQNNNVQNVKRRFDDKFNAFSDKDVNENTITPIPTIKYLRKATPIKQVGKWKLINETSFNNVTLDRYNPNVSLDGNLEYGLIAFQDRIDTGFADAIENFSYVKAKNTLKNGTLELNVKVTFKYRPNGESDTEGRFGLNIVKYKFPYNVGDEVVILNPYNKLFSGSENQDFVLDDIIEVNLPDMLPDERLAIYWFDVFSSSAPINNMALFFERYNFDITYTSTAIDQVINVVRYIDLMKQASKFNQNIPINSPLFDVDGIHYNNFLFNKRMVTQRTDFLYTTPKEVFENVVEVNCDYEIKEDEIFIGNSQDDFYTNDEIGVFNIIPSEDFSVYENDKAQVNKFTYGYKSYEQDRTTIGTSESFNTESEWRFLNENVENVKEIKVDFVRDSKAIQKAVDLEITQPTTSTTDDDKLYIENGTQLAPNTSTSITRNLLMREIGLDLEILNRDSQDDKDEVSFLWTNLGLTVGTTFEITETKNIGTYTILSITPNVIKLQPLIATVNYTGDAYISFNYVYTGVFWTTRTNQGFSLIEGVDTSFGNIAYSIKRNMQYFKKYFAMCLLYAKKNITLGYFKNNGSVKTQLLTETEPLIENAPILYNILPTPVISPKVYNFSVYAEFSDIYNLLELYKTKRGFIRGLNSNSKVIKGYIQKLEHNWSENKAEVTIEERFETEYLVLTYADGVLFVNDTPYNLSGVANWWRFKNDYLQLFDEKSRPISNGYKYNFVILNGISYNSKLDLTNALINL